MVKLTDSLAKTLQALSRTLAKGKQQIIQVVASAQSASARSWSVYLLENDIPETTDD
jgi:hypothetical protein